MAASGSVNVLHSLAHLQDAAKRDPQAYRDEFRMQHRRFLAELEMLNADPSAGSASMKELLAFISQVAPWYRDDLVEFPTQLSKMLSTHADALRPDMRKALLQSLMLMRTRNMIEPVPVHKLLFQLYAVQDKHLRAMIFDFIVNDVKDLNTGRRNESVNRQLQSFMYSLVSKEDRTLAKKSLDTLIELYRRKVWTDAKTVNVVAMACLSPHTKLAVCGMRFFVGLVANDDDDDDDDDDTLEGSAKRKANQQSAIGQVAKGRVAKNDLHLHSKKTRKRARQTARAQKKATKQAAGEITGGDKAAAAAAAAFPAIQLLHDPQTLAEKLLQRQKRSRERFEVRLLRLDMVTRLVGQHKLLVLPLYTYVQRFIQPRQQSVTQILAYLVQGTHEMVPPEEVMPVVRTIADQFVTDRCPDEAIQVGLNSLRALVARCPLVTEEPGMDDLVSDLILYRKYREKGVAAAARSVLNLVREVNPTILRRRDRGKEAAQSAAKPAAFGQVVADQGVAGAELLDLWQHLKGQQDQGDDEDAWDHAKHAEKEDSEEEDSDIEWVSGDDDDSSDEEEEAEEEGEEAGEAEEEEKEGGDGEAAVPPKLPTGDAAAASSAGAAGGAAADGGASVSQSIASSLALALPLEQRRILTPKDLAELRALRPRVLSALERRKRGKKRRRLTPEEEEEDRLLELYEDLQRAKRGEGEGDGKSLTAGLEHAAAAGAGGNDDDDASSVDSDDPEAIDLAVARSARQNLGLTSGAVHSAPVNEVNPMHLDSQKARRQRNVQLRLESMAETREDQRKMRSNSGKKAGGATNKEKQRKKNFLMLRKSGAVQAKLRASLQDQQRALRAHAKRMKINALSKKVKKRRF